MSVLKNDVLLQPYRKHGNMKETLATPCFDDRRGVAAATAPVMMAGVCPAHDWTRGSNSVKMDCCCFCIRQKAIDLIERRVIPADADAAGVTECGVVSPAAVIGMTGSVFFENKPLVSDNSPRGGVVADSFFF